MSHVRLYFGPPYSDKEEQAHQFARTLLQGDRHNLFEYYPEGKTAMHPISSIRALIEEAQTRPFEAPHKVLMIHGADRMLPSSANALLKTLEEPLETTSILLLTADLDSLLSTIRSRCVKIACHTKSAKPLPSLEDVEQMREKDPYTWSLEVDRLLEAALEEHKHVPGMMERVAKAREALLCNMRLKVALDYLRTF